MTETEIWTKWESQIVNGLFPLRRFLGRSNHSVVFLTEYKTQNSAKAAIKLVPADPALADLPVGGAFRTDQIEAIFAALENNFGVHAEWTDPQHVRFTSGRDRPPSRE